MDNDNGITGGRVERDHGRQPWNVPGDTEMAFARLRNAVTSTASGSGFDDSPFGKDWDSGKRVTDQRIEADSGEPIIIERKKQ